MSYGRGSVCQYFLQGNCRYGDNCWNEHPRYNAGGGSQAAFRNAGSNRRGAWSGHNQRYSNVQTSNFSKASNWRNSRDNGDLGFSQNRFSALSATENVGSDGIKDDDAKILEIIMKDMETWESSGQWMFSCYSPSKEKPNISGFPSFLPEELRLEYYNCRANNNLQNYISSVQQLIAQWRSRLLELKNINASTKAALVSELNNVAVPSQPAFGFGGQQSPAFGTSTFPVNKPSSAQAFSFKTTSNLANVSSGGTPAFGTLASVPNLPLLGTAASSTTSHSVGFGNQPAAAAAASFSFQNPTASGGFGASGFSGFGKSLPPNSSGITSASVFGAAVVAPTLNSGGTLFGQPAHTAGSNVAVASPVTPTSIPSEKLFTPKAELSAEELKQFEAKKFTLGKIPLKPPPLELISV